MLCDLLYLSLSCRRYCVSVPKISLIIACIIGVIAYRLAVYAAFASIMKDSPTAHLQVVGPLITPQLATSVTASCINFVIIMILNLMYEKVAIWITDMGEAQRGNGGFITSSSCSRRGRPSNWPFDCFCVFQKFPRPTWSMRTS